MAMSEKHKEALADGRRQARSIKAYLEALGKRRPGRPVTPEGIKSRLARVESQLGGATDPLERVRLIQLRLDLKRGQQELTEAHDISLLEAGFVDAAKVYSERKGITYAAWREAGVPAAVLKRAGVAR